MPAFGFTQVKHRSKWVRGVFEPPICPNPLRHVLLFNPPSSSIKQLTQNRPQAEETGKVSFFMSRYNVLIYGKQKVINTFKHGAPFIKNKEDRRLHLCFSQQSAQRV